MISAVMLTGAEISTLARDTLFSVVNLTAARTNVLYGIVHLVLFFTYVILMFD